MPKHFTGHPKYKYPLLLLTILLLAGAASLFIYFQFFRPPTPLSPYNQVADDGLLASDLERLSTDTYESVLLSMHSSASYSEEDFALFRGLDTAIAAHTLLNTRELSRYLQCILDSGNAVSHIYLCPDPELLWLEADENQNKWTRLLTKGLYKYVEAHPEITFELLLPYPHLDYWLSLEDEEFETLLNAYRLLVTELDPYENVKLFFPGFEPWLLANPDHYTNFPFDANEIIAQKIFLYTFCDGAYEIVVGNQDFFWDSLTRTRANELANPAKYPDLSQWDIVFFGDSVLGNFEGSFSIPGYVTGLSGAVTHNLAIGGTCGADSADGRENFPQVLDSFLSKPISFTEKNLCFVINYGFNDYFSGLPADDSANPRNINTFAGSMRVCIEKLRNAYPDAALLLVTPTHTSQFENGTSKLTEVGGVLSDYVNAAEAVAAETGIFFLDNYNDSVITIDNLDEYISDGTHPGEHGRLTLAKILMKYMEENILPQ